MRPNGLPGVASTTEAKTACRCPLQVVDIKRATVSHLDADRPHTAVWFPVKADLPGYSTVWNFWMSTIQPTWGIGSTPVPWDTRSRHFSSGRILEAKPTRTKQIVTMFSKNGIWGLSCCVSKGLVILAFFYKKDRDMQNSTSSRLVYLMSVVVT